jgi:hypothetical protein
LFQVADDSRSVFLKHKGIDGDEVNIGFYYFGYFYVCFGPAGSHGAFARLGQGRRNQIPGD